MEHNTTKSSWGTLFHLINGHLIGQQDWFKRALIWQAIWLLLLIEVAGQADVPPPSTVPVGSYLPPKGSTNPVVLVSPDGIMFNFRIEEWGEYPSRVCMAGVMDMKIGEGGAMLWEANDAKPLIKMNVSSTCRLFLSPDGDLRLQYDDVQIAWRTHTGGMGVSNLTLQNDGNLVLHTKQGLIVWQSFTQSPAFALNSGMNLTSNMTIYSRSDPIVNGATNFCVRGRFAMQLHNHSTLVLFTNDNSSKFVYWSTSPTNLSPSHTNTQQVSYVALDEYAFTFYDNSSRATGSIFTSRPPSNYSSALRSVAHVDPSSANLKAWYRTEDRWEPFYNSSISVCENPMHCRNFGLCNASGVCTCPPFFRQTSAAGDCEPETGLSFPSDSCSLSALSSVQASSYRFVSVNVSFHPQLSAVSSNSVENCTSQCRAICECNAALFDPGTSSCSLFSNLQTLPSTPDSKQLLLLKIVTKQGSTNRHLATVLGAISAAIAVSLCLICAIASAKRRKNRNSSSRRAPNEEDFLQALPRLPPRYTYKELEAATNKFSTKLGAGACGAVYEGVLPSGVKIAVKKLEEGSGQSSAQFRAEVASIGSVSHVNLVILKGFCHEGDERLLVYEHMGKGSLDMWLFQREEKEGQKLGWERRCKIAMDTAKGLAYLHHQCGERIVHCDVKPENILLDEEFNAKVGDFGLAKLVGQGRESFAMTNLKGTRGYLAPEWLQDATITAKSDVYSFGVVLLELISGRRCLDSEYGYLPTLAFHIISTSSSNSSHPSNLIRESDWKEVVSTPTPVEQPIQDFGTSYEKAIGRKESASPLLELIQGSANISHNRETGSKGSFSPPRESIPGSLTIHDERITAGSKEFLPPASSTRHKRITGSKEYIVASVLPSPSSASDHMSCQSTAPPSHGPPFQHVTLFDNSSMAALLDPHLSSDADLLSTSLERMIFIGLWCVQPNSALRPSMSAVVQMMEGVVDVPRPPIMQNPLWETQESFAFTSTSSSTSRNRAAFSYQRLDSQCL